MIQILLPMGGIGLRFQSRYPGIFKPFIKVHDKYLFQYALESLEGLNTFKVFFILKEEDAIKYQSMIKSIIPRSEIIPIATQTRGAMETCFLAKDLIDPNEKLLILDSDLSFQSPSFIEFINHSKTNENGFPTFEANTSQFSYCETVNNQVVRTAEKKVISNQAIVGAYYFGAASSFFQNASKILSSEKPSIGEFYISPLFNELIKQGQSVCSFKTQDYFSLGTPEEIDTYLESVL